MTVASIVVDNEITFMSASGPDRLRGELHRVSAGVTPHDVFATLPGLLSRLAAAFGKHENDGGTVLLGADNIRRLGWPEQAPADLAEAKAHPVLTPAREAGWRVDRLGPWMTFHRSATPTVHIGVLPWLDSDTFELIAKDPATMAYRLQWMGTRLRTPYRARPGVTALAAMRLLVPGKAPYWKPDWNKVQPVGPFEERMRWEAPYIWDSAQADALQLGHKWLHGWDIRGQFLAAASGVYLARDALRHTKKEDYDGSAGYWRIVVPPWNYGAVLPHPAGQGYSAGDVTWVTSPRLELLRKLADQYQVISMPQILDSWTAEKPQRLLRPWAECIRDMVTDARQEADPDDAVVLSRAGKHAYTHAIAMLRSPDSSIHRVDWNDGISGYADCGFWLKLWIEFRTSGRTPVKIFHDTAYYASSEIDPEKDRPITFEPSTNLGRFKYGKSIEL
jgi:hypothetical protein